MVKAAAILVGLIFLLIGIVGFVPAITSANGMLLGIFHVNTAHNIVHLASGIVFLLCGMAGTGPSQTFFRIFGIILGVVGLLGFFYGDNALLGIVANNTAGTWLYVVLAVVMLFFGFAPSGSKAPV
ncbi:MAG: DUF4383 domain-containing protein [Verrucomicrobia bacterium]|nr:MAG: DUF4383 domain-containing protein [Verrucomicrobiota bacterium]